MKIFVAATSRTDSVWFDFLRLVAATKFCCGDKDFHKNSPAHTKRFVAATCRLTLLLQLVARPVHTEWSVAATCCSNLSPSVYRPLCPDKRSLVCGSGEELAEDPLTLSAMKSPAYAPICCFKIVIRWCCALQTIRRLASLFSTNLKHALSSWNLPQAIFIEKKNEAIISLVVIRCALESEHVWNSLDDSALNCMRMTVRNWCKWFLSYYR